MRCLIADLVVDISAAGGMDLRCREYLYSGTETPDIIIDSMSYDGRFWPGLIDENNIAYMESSRHFYLQLLYFNGFYLHSSAVELNGKAYLFSANPGVGKSTHTRLWKSIYGEAAQIFNDDKPALRRIDGRWYAYGTPWCGKDGINQNKKVPLGGICFLKQGDVNSIRRLSAFEAVQKILSQTIYKLKMVEKMDLLLECIEHIVREIPIFELTNRPEEAAAQLSHDTMCKAAEEMKL